jgi:hypothetical protein
VHCNGPDVKTFTMLGSLGTPNPLRTFDLDHELVFRSSWIEHRASLPFGMRRQLLYAEVLLQFGLWIWNLPSPFEIRESLCWSVAHSVPLRRTMEPLPARYPRRKPLSHMTNLLDGLFLHGKSEEPDPPAVRLLFVASKCTRNASSLSCKGALL